MLPPPTVLKSFEELVGPLIDRIAANLAETRSLISLRDMLLSQLISGKLRLRDCEKALLWALLAPFARLIDRIQPTEVEIQNAVQHAKQIKTRLEQSYICESCSRQEVFHAETYIHSSSDIDLFAVFARDDVRWGDSYVRSSTALDNCRRELEARYPASTVYRDVHAIVVFFSDG